MDPALLSDINSMDDEFPFSFGSGSDSDEDANSLFCAPKTKGTRAAAPAAPVVARPAREPYQAQIDMDGDKHGAIKVKMQADHCYMLHQYQNAYDIAQEFCRIVASRGMNIESEDQRLTQPETVTEGRASVLKVTDSKEMQEMALRCALKLGRFHDAAAIADKLTMHDTGVVFLRSKAYLSVGKYNDAATILVRHQKSRSSNYSIWKALAECFHQSTEPTADSDARRMRDTHMMSVMSPSVITALALISILRARHLMRVSNWSQVDYAQARYDREMRAIEDLKTKLEERLGLSLEGVADAMHSGRSSEGGADRGELQDKLRDEYGIKVVSPVQQILERVKEKGEEQQRISEGDYAAEVVAFVVSAWDEQLLDTCSSGSEVVDEEEAGEMGVRHK
ncbi:hypothetical protein BGZ98_004521 [Dissophora globulifera]|nr:hypothetical protein BGZ98_004521 [Dissophora globulifera]